MSDIEIKIEALRRCVSQDAYEKALAEIQGEAAPPTVEGKAPGVIEAIYQAVLDMAIPSHIKGHPYTVRAIELVVNNPDMIHDVTGGIYPTIAEEFDTTASRVERAIRHAIEVGWSRADFDTQMQYFGYTVSPNKGKPTNSEFIAQIASIIRRKIKANK